MKNFKYFSTLKSATLLVFTLLAVSACGKKGGDNNTVPPVGGLYPGCVGCQVGGQPLLDNVKFNYGTYTPYFDGVLQIFPDTASAGYVDLNDTKAIVAYNGRIFVNGILNITNQFALCGAIPGQYTLQTVQPGYSNRGVIGGLRLIAQGPSQILLESQDYPYSEVYTDPSVQPNFGVYRGSTANRIGLNMNLTVNGQGCGTVSTY